MAHIDRRQIEGLLGEHFPTMKGSSSDDWHAFLNAQTGLDVALGEDNSSAFDKWRKALFAQGFPVWEHSAHEEAAFKARGDELKRKAEEWRAAEAEAARHPEKHWLAQERAALKEAREAAKPERRW